MAYDVNDALDVVDIESSSISANTGAITITARNASFGDDEDAEFFEANVFTSLGFKARPYPKDDNGSPQAIIARSQDYTIGVTDTRSSGAVQNLKPGDVALFSTGPQHASRIFLREEERQSVILSKDNNDKDMVLLMDGSENKITINAFKCIFQMDDDGITIGCSGPGASPAIIMKKSGELILKGSNVKIGDGQFVPGVNSAAIGPTGPANVLSSSVLIAS